MFCPSCNRRNQFFSNYCYHCGYRLKGPAVPDKTTLSEADDNQREGQIFKGYRPDQTEKTPMLIGEALVDAKDLQDIVEISDITQDVTDGVDKNHADSYPDDEYSPQWEDSQYSDFPEDHSFYQDNKYLSVEPKGSLDLNPPMPLRRYQKNKAPTRSNILSKIILTISIIVLIGLVVFVANRLLSHKPKDYTGFEGSIVVSSAVEQTIKDGEKAYRVVLHSDNGQEAELLGEIAIFDNGLAEFLLEETTLYSLFPQLNSDGLYEVVLDVTIRASNLPDEMERISIVLLPPYHYASFTLLEPSTSSTEFDGDSTKVVFKINPDSTVYINDQDFTHLVSGDGRFEKKFNLTPQQEELVLDIRVTEPGCLDNIQQLILRRTIVDVPIAIDQVSPILSDEQWVKVTGVTNPKATIDTDREVFEDPVVDDTTGEFEIYIKAEYPGYTPCTIKSKANGKESSVEIILDRKTDVDTYTSTAWKPDYDQLQGNENLNSGRHFVFVGGIKDIIKTGEQNIFTVQLTDSGESDRLFYVEYWGNFDMEPGEKVKVFANRWGNKEGIPRFLAKYIYRP
ncbi:MAG: hypothetical protein GX352_04840 [Clostridiales bacterium]|mgnify:CR=1 FL=1|nr:hypothetical protein [Clostridiales bacterium]